VKDVMAGKCLSEGRARPRLRAALVLALLAIVPAGAAGQSPAEIEFFEKKVRPVLVEHCYKCHSTAAGKSKGGLLLDSRDGLRKGGDSGPAVVPGKPEEGLLLRAVRYTDADLRMPPKGKLPSAVVADLEKWIAGGAPDPRSASIALTPPRTPREHWAFQPVTPPAVPEVKNSAWVRTSVDRFILARLEQRGLSPAPSADRRTLLRRVTFDLTGLPPTSEEIDAFLADTSPDAFARVVDRLLASPAYGERLGRHWLDVVRYADTAGETADFPAPHAWRYRNYVIAAFNADRPYDQFLREQIAGDVLASRLPPGAPPERRAELLTATGYLAIARRFGFDIAQDHYLTIEDTIDVLGKSVLGLTVACARCHDHKYDPVSQADYYALYGIFASTRYPFPGCEKEKRPRDLVPLGTSALAYAVAEGKPKNARIHKRGEPNDPGAEVARRFLSMFGGQPVPADGGSGRLALAGWLTDPTNPLVARVLVNRLWQHHFGRGLVATPNDFGTRGSPPSHPELLDHLADRFVRSGWSIKELHRLILLSAVYQQSSRADPAAVLGDPDGTWLSRFPRRRLSAEEVRDAVLAVAGDLDRTPGGPHPFPDEKTWGFTQHNPFTAVYDHERRSVYLMTQRIARHPFLGLFDGADPSSSTGRRDTTTVPTQALFFLNDPFIHAKSARLAERLLALPDDSARLDRLCRLCLGRPATPGEVHLAGRFLAGYAVPATDEVGRRKQAWAAWVRVVLASNEFLYVE
jgi:hypothetical protein